ncbi:MAG: hypothetical protein LRY46_01365 [Candidatus Pacebacteria bacterium]|nr:hypothetical protein [Candidatus Paceibacterota bacterium]
MSRDTSFIDTLAKEGHTILAEALRKTAHMTPHAYSAEIWTYRPKHPIDPFLKKSAHG